MIGRKKNEEEHAYCLCVCDVAYGNHAKMTRSPFQVGWATRFAYKNILIATLLKWSHPASSCKCTIDRYSEHAGIVR
jgi:hypothetical protein